MDGYDCDEASDGQTYERSESRRDGGKIYEDEYRCSTCGRTFDSRRGLDTHVGRLHKKTSQTYSCLQCETEFRAESRRKYCSDECRLKSSSQWGPNNPNYKGGKTESVCKLCGETFEFYLSEKKGRFCSDCVQTERWQNPPRASGEDNPRWNGRKRCVDCVVCGTTVERYPSNIGKTTVCSVDCRGTWLSEKFSGSGHPNWKGGGNEAYGKGWNRVRKYALKRVEYCCSRCGITRDELERNPDVHHIVPVRWFVNSDEHRKEDAHFLENVISLCIRCHRKADFGKITRDELWSLIGVGDPVLDP